MIKSCKVASQIGINRVITQYSTYTVCSAQLRLCLSNPALHVWCCNQSQKKAWRTSFRRLGAKINTIECFSRNSLLHLWKFKTLGCSFQVVWVDAQAKWEGWFLMPSSKGGCSFLRKRHAPGLSNFQPSRAWLRLSGEEYSGRHQPILMRPVPRQHYLDHCGSKK